MVDCGRQFPTLRGGHYGGGNCMGEWHSHRSYSPVNITNIFTRSGYGCCGGGGWFGGGWFSGRGCCCNSPLNWAYFTLDALRTVSDTARSWVGGCGINMSSMFSGISNIYGGRTYAPTMPTKTSEEDKKKEELDNKIKNYTTQFETLRDTSPVNTTKAKDLYICIKNLYDSNPNNDDLKALLQRITQYMTDNNIDIPTDTKPPVGVVTQQTGNDPEVEKLSEIGQKIVAQIMKKPTDATDIKEWLIALQDLRKQNDAVEPKAPNKDSEERMQRNNRALFTSLPDAVIALIDKDNAIDDNHGITSDIIANGKNTTNDHSKEIENELIKKLGNNSGIKIEPSSGKITLSVNSVLFGENEYSLTDGAKGILHSVKDVLSSHTNEISDYWITGFANQNAGDGPYNRELGMNRARNVESELGLINDKEKCHTASSGAYEKYYKADENGNILSGSRRVEIVIYIS